MNRWIPQKFLTNSKNQNLFIKQDCIPAWCVLPTRWLYLPACSALGGCLLLGGSAPGGCLLPGVCPREVSAPRGWGVCSGGCLLWGIPACTEADPPPPVNRITHACEDIKLPKLHCGVDPVHLFLSLSSETEFRRKPLPIAVSAVAYANCTNSGSQSQSNIQCVKTRWIFFSFSIRFRILLVMEGLP